MEVLGGHFSVILALLFLCCVSVEATKTRSHVSHVSDSGVGLALSSLGCVSADRGAPALASVR